MHKAARYCLEVGQAKGLTFPSKRYKLEAKRRHNQRNRSHAILHTRGSKLNNNNYYYFSNK